MIINTKNPEQAKKQILAQIKEETISNIKKPIIVQAQDDTFNRKLLEYGKFQILLSPETGNRKNSIRQIDSGLNHVLAKIATKNKIAIGINLEEISKLSPEKKAKRLSKIKQNISITKKAKTDLYIKGNKKLGFHLLISLGASTEQAKKATSYHKIQKTKSF